MALKREDFANVAREKLSDLQKKTPREPLETFSVRLTARDKEILGEHFRRRGLGLTQGLRMVIYEYMTEKGLK